MATQTQAEPWYKVGFVWLVVGIPLSAVIMGGVILYFSIVSFDGMVVDDYYKEGKQINRVLKRDKAALDHGLRAQVGVEGNRLTVFLASNNIYTPPPVMEVSFYYATRDGQDKATFVERQRSGIYQGEIASLETGRWNVQIEADDWRLIGSMWAPDEAQVIIEPAVKK
jgi:hypothetical protein